MVLGCKHRKLYAGKFSYQKFVFSSLLKIWNMNNKYTGVLGVYNCQGAAWNSVERKNTFHETKSEALTGAFKDLTPIKVLALGFSFAPLGLIAMYNADGAIDGLMYEVKGGAKLSKLDEGYKDETSIVSDDLS
ncbi:probable galactinol--sucrose galactosyltransferase 6 [Mercurialis annua]|uniref:probable galactinol--sucrose galactosyltransferase 6 n=1 Tax=Mercurialis annua TaxID=3986 RepID=UPI0024AF9A6A|nr:probable galactinol--sucrose galactosyltransferase 6 [Mercurialis annua]